jgi:hypothetical protein
METEFPGQIRYQTEFGNELNAPRLFYVYSLSLWGWKYISRLGREEPGKMGRLG